MSRKVEMRLRRARKARIRIHSARKHRLSVYRSARHIYAQVISSEGDRTLVSASSLEADLRKDLKNGGGIEAARVVGTEVAKRAIEANINAVAFDRSGFQYHGRIKALAEAAREAGLTI